MGPLLSLALMLLTGCAPDFSVERDAGIYGVWAKRGQLLDDMAHLYCEQGAEREQDMMAWAMRRYSYPAKVTIECADYELPPRMQPPAP